MTFGGELQSFFGIMNGRTREQIKRSNKSEDDPEYKYWLKTIPDEYKPTDYKKIEHGCYW